MALKFEVIGRKAGPLELQYDWHKLALYALSVGANVNGELEYVYEKNSRTCMDVYMHVDSVTKTAAFTNFS